MLEIVITDEQAKVYLECLELAKRYWDGIAVVCNARLGDPESTVRITDTHAQITLAGLKSDSLTVEIHALARALANARRRGRQGTRRKGKRRKAARSPQSKVQAP